MLKLFQNIFLFLCLHSVVFPISNLLLLLRPQRMRSSLRNIYVWHFRPLPVSEKQENGQFCTKTTIDPHLDISIRGSGHTQRKSTIWMECAMRLPSASCFCPALHPWSSVTLQSCNSALGSLLTWCVEGDRENFASFFCRTEDSRFTSYSQIMYSHV